MTKLNEIERYKADATKTVRRHEGDFRDILPRSFRTEAFLRIAENTIARNDDLVQASLDAPDTVIVALLNAARLGLEPGTAQFYLVPFKENVGKDNERQTCQGITGYQGHVELMYRGQLVTGVFADYVMPGDRFEFVRGVHPHPVHGADWFGDRDPVVRVEENERGEKREVRAGLQGAYAYCRLADGGYSETVILNRAQIEKRRDMSRGYTYYDRRTRERKVNTNSPWVKWWEDMVRKSPLRIVHKLVPTSAEYQDLMRDRLVRAARRAEDSGIDPARLGTTEAPDEVPGETDPVPHQFEGEVGAGCSACDLPEDDPVHDPLSPA